MFNDYIAVTRPDHWIKNIFMLAGSCIVLLLYPDYLETLSLVTLISAFISTCIVASSNYVLNEILDANQDRSHPKKRDRPLAKGKISKHEAYILYIALSIIGLILSYNINKYFFLAALALWAMGIIYNAPPIRSKEVPIVDVLSEAINNPIRLYLGWFAITDAVSPPRLR